MMDTKAIRLFLPICMIFSVLFQLQAQEQDSTQAPQREDAVRIFIDCERCDMNYIREEIPYVNYVRDVKEAQVYILETRENTGSGGRKYTYAFVGQQDFLGRNDTLSYSSAPDETRDYIRIWRTQMLKMGLMPYVATSPLFKEIVIDPTDRVEKQVVEDRWNNWVFELDAEPRMEAEESLKELSLRSSISASKITHDWKVELEFDHRYIRTQYTYNDTLNTEYRNSQGLDILLVKSLGDHWSAGIRSELLSSSYNNIDFSWDFMPSVEYNIFPYEQSTHKQLRFLYGIGTSLRNYVDSTIYNQMEELLWQQSLQIAWEVREKWGSVNLSLEGSNFFHDFSKNRLVLNGFVSIRVLKGLSFRVGGSAARINDQLSLVKDEASEADILLRLQELQTRYNIRGEVGVTYTFGSIYNNIVNPRFGNGRRRFF